MCKSDWKVDSDTKHFQVFIAKFGFSFSLIVYVDLFSDGSYEVNWVKMAMGYVFFLWKPAIYNLKRHSLWFMMGRGGHDMVGHLGSVLVYGVTLTLTIYDFFLVWTTTLTLLKCIFCISLRDKQLGLHFWCTIIVIVWHCSDDNVHWSFIMQLLTPWIKHKSTPFLFYMQ